MTNYIFNLAIAEVVLYAILIQPILYLALRWRASLAGFFGWFMLNIFCILQLVSSAMILSAGSQGTPSETALIIQSVGLSPLILGTYYLLRCSIAFTPLKTNYLFHHSCGLAFHLGVMGGIAMAVTGFSLLYGDDSSSSAKPLSQAGIVVIAVFWLFLMFIAMLSVFFVSSARGYRPLLLSAFVASILIAIRVVYALLSAFDTSDAAVGFVTATVAVRVVLDFLPAALVTLMFVVAGFLSLDGLRESSEGPRRMYGSGERMMTERNSDKV